MAHSPRIRVICCLTVLVLYYLALFGNVFTARTLASAGKKRLSVEESRRLLDKSRSLMRQERWKDALGITRRLHDAYPQNHIYIFQLATIYHHQSDFEQEAATWERYLEVAPTPTEGCPMIGQAYEAMGRTADALAAFERCLAFDRRDPDMIFFLARGLERAGKLAEARDAYASGAQISDTYPDLRIGLARARLRLGELEEAVRDSETIEARWPDNVDGLLVVGLVRRSEGRLDEARRVLERGVKKSSQYADFHAILGGIAEQQGRTADAVEAYGRVLRIDPNNTAIESRRRRLMTEGATR